MVLGYNVVKPGAGPYYRHFRALRRPFCAPRFSIGSGILFSAGNPAWKRFACRLHCRALYILRAEWICSEHGGY